jgi:hypothetical protein
LITPAEATPAPATPVEFAKAALSNVTHDPARVATFEEPCKKCRGRGRFISYAGRDCGPCFTCKGTGKQVFKTSAESRQQKADAEKARKAAKFNAWIETNSAEWAWMVAASGRGFDFALSMIEALGKYDYLTDRQMAAIHKCMAADERRTTERAAIEAKAPDITGAALDKIDTAFATAIENSIKFPKLRLGTFIFSAVRTGANAGAIYVKTIEKNADGERRYMGKIVEGKFVRAFRVTDEEEQAIIAAALDPEAAAKAYGQRTGHLLDLRAGAYQRRVDQLRHGTDLPWQVWLVLSPSNPHLPATERSARMNLIKYPFYAAVAACAIVAGSAAPVAAKERQTRSERHHAQREDRDDTPYSNRSMRREREARRIAREIAQDRQRERAYHESRDDDDDIYSDDEEDSD